jgi:hypothetical protein
VSSSNEFLAKLPTILNDAVVDYGYSASAVGMRVSIGLSDGAMSRPAGMPDGYVAGKAGQVELPDDIVNLAGIFPYQQFAIGQGGYAR